MAKKNKKTLIKLESTADTGYFYTTKKNPANPKLELMKFDPVVRKHVKFVEKRLK